MAEAAAAVGALGVALLVPGTSRVAAGAGLLLVLAAMAGLASAGDRLDAVGDLFGSPAGVAAAVAGATALAAAAAVLARWPLTIVPALLVVAPLRLPIATDPDSPTLFELVGGGGLGRPYPFYGVLAAATIALAWRALRGAPIHRLPRGLALPVAAFLGLIAISLLWSEDQGAARNDLLFTWLPMALAVSVSAQAPFAAASPRALAVTLVGVSAAFAGVALWQAASEQLFFFTVALEQANEFSRLFRVTAAFQDPNHLGRHLVLAIAVVLAAAWAARLGLSAAVALLALLTAGLWFTYSQSSAVTLATVALAVAILSAGGGARRLLGATAALAAVGAVIGLAALLAQGSAEAVTSDRSALVRDTAAVAATHPVVGVGVSGQPRATRDQEAPEATKLESVSHTTPLTVAAELGVVGLTAFVALIVGAVRALVELARRDRALALGLGAVLAALLVHSLFYAGLLENPITWGALGVAAAALSQGHRDTREPREPLRS